MSNTGNRNSYCRQTTTTESFFLLGARPLIEDTPTYKLHQLIDWAVIGAQLKGLYRRELRAAVAPSRMRRCRCSS
ncbi:hypothetical protein [Tepidimonas taiwanensis]|uniref:hypothetical protein n=1 Tax=Tepidimonas taiwanensis TaxID=307486 RepID=UPI0005BD56C9|nr:hypothetical protein [Tepidimonas taiwanensis]